MKVLAGSKFLGALLAALAVGQSASSATASQLRRPAPDAEEPTRDRSDVLRPQLGDELGPSWPEGPPLWSDAHGFPLDLDAAPRVRR